MSKFNLHYHSGLCFKLSHPEETELATYKHFFIAEIDGALKLFAWYVWVETSEVQTICDLQRAWSLDFNPLKPLYYVATDDEGRWTFNVLRMYDEKEDRWVNFPFAVASSYFYWGEE